MNTFFCFGLPRSGTSAMVSTLNHKDDVFCGYELFPFPDHINNSLTTEYIEDFVYLNGNKNKNNYQKKSGRALRAIGNKQPFYYQMLDGVEEANPGASLIAIFRDIPFVMKSCNARARNAEDEWPSGMIGALSGYMIVDMCHCILTHPHKENHYIFEYHNLLFSESTRLHIERLFEAIGIELDAHTYDAISRSQQNYKPDGNVDLTHFSKYEIEIINLLEANQLKQIFSSCSGPQHADWEQRIGAWLAGYVEKAVEIENLILRELNENVEISIWEKVRGMMGPFGTSISGAIALGLPYRSVFIEIPQLRETTQVGRVLSILLDMVNPDMFAIWEKGSGGEILKEIFSSIDDELWRVFVCSILIRGANISGKPASINLIKERFSNTK